jgi:hypothetical protein
MEREQEEDEEDEEDEESIFYYLSFQGKTGKNEM